MFAQSPEEVRRKQAEEFRRRRSRNYTINHEGLDWAFVDGEKEGDTRINCYRCDCNDRIMGKHCKKIITKKHTSLGWEEISKEEWNKAREKLGYEKI